MPDQQTFHAIAPPASLIDGSPTRPWHHVSGDHRRPSSPEGFDLYWDAANQFGMVHPRAEDPWQTLIYYDTEDQVYYTHSAPLSGAGGRDSLPFLTRLLRRLAWMADRGTPLSEQEIDRLCPRRPASILDIGCGSGRLLVKCRDLGHAVQGVEPDPVARELATARGLVVLEGTGEALPEPIRTQTFDIIIVSHVLHHCVDPTRALRNLADRLAPGGRLICEVPNQECLGATWAGIAWGHLDVPRQLNVFTLQSLGRMIERSSLRIEEVRWTQYCRQFNPAVIENERHKFDFFEARGASRAALPVKPSLLGRYALLARTLFAQDKYKYDSVRIIAQKPDEADQSV